MNISARASSSFRSQHGAVSLAIVMVLVFLLAAAVMAVMRISGSSVSDSAMNEEQTAALSLAESGLEKAQATLTAAAKNGSNLNNACTGLAGANLGRGSFQYSTHVYNSATGDCTVTVNGSIGSSTRTLRAVLNAQVSQGTEGNGSSIPLEMVTTSKAGIITNLAYPSDPANSGATASVGSCTNPGNCSNVLNVTSTGSKNMNNTEVFAGVSAADTYKINETLVDAGNNPAARDYVEVGVAFYPTGGNSVGFVGSYGANSGSSKTANTLSGSNSGSVPSNWNCAPNSGSGSASVAAGADTLVYGFSSISSSTSKHLNGVTFGSKSLTNIRDMSRKQGDNLYSQIWYANNPAYLSGTGSISGAVVTGYAGKGSISGKPSGSNLCVASYSVYSGESFGSGDSVSGSNLSSGTALNGSMQTSGSVLCNCNGGSWQMAMMGDMDMGGGYTCKNGGSTYKASCPLNKSQSGSSSATMMVAAAILTVTSVSKGILEPGDTIYVGGNPKGKIVKQLTKTVTAYGKEGTYQLDQDQLFSPTTITSDGMYISTSGSSAPIAGTLVDVSSGPSTGAFPPGTTVLANPAPTSSMYKVSARPTTRLSGSGAQICGGVCALLNNNGMPTTFTLSNITSTDDWSSGFTCLKNVDTSKINLQGEVISSQRSKWSEVVQ